MFLLLLLLLLSLLRRWAVDGLRLSVVRSDLPLLADLVLSLLLRLLLLLAFLALLWRALWILHAYLGLPLELALAIFLEVLSDSSVFPVVSGRTVLVESLALVARRLVSFTVFTLLRPFVLRSSSRRWSGHGYVGALHLLLHLDLGEANHGGG